MGCDEPKLIAAYIPQKEEKYPDECMNGAEAAVIHLLEQRSYKPDALIHATKKDLEHFREELGDTPERKELRIDYLVRDVLWKLLDRGEICFTRDWELQRNENVR